MSAAGTPGGRLGAGARALRQRAATRVQPGDDTGVVMVFVILSMVVVSLFVSAGLSYAVQTQGLSRRDADRNAALAAAQAGIDDYLARLNRDDTYWQNVDCANPAVPRPGLAGCPAVTRLGWQPVNPAQPSGPAYHYDVDASLMATAGTMTVRSTGRVGTSTRTVQATVAKDNSTDHLYYTDHESADPTDSYAYPSGMPAACANYWWGPSPDTAAGTTPTRRKDTTGCAETTFSTSDVLDGSAFTNDTPGMSTAGGGRPTFHQGLLTAEPQCALAVPGSPTTYGNCDRTMAGANYTSRGPALGSLHYLQDGSAGFAAAPGCKYRGATRLVFNGDGTMRVWSRRSTASAACGGTAPLGVTVQVPDNQVIYVSDDTTEALHRCWGGEIDGTGPTSTGYSGTLPLGNFRGTTNENHTYDNNFTKPELFCGHGNVYVEGVVTKRVTVASSDSVVVTNNLSVDDLAGRAMIGLVADGAVQVYHPMRVTVSGCTSSGTQCLTSSPADAWCSSHGLRIDAALQALRRSFFVQEYASGCHQGTLLVNGSMAQKWRGRVGSSSLNTGYTKDYRYDKRLLVQAPPYFPYWTNASWRVRLSGETAPAYPASA